MLLFLICYVPIGLIFLALGLYQLRRARAEGRLAQELAENGRVAQGEIIAHTLRTQGRRSFWSVSFTYEEHGQRYEGEQEVGHDHYELLTDGEAVDVRYLPGDPYVALLADEDRDDARMKRYRSAAITQLGIALVCILLLLVSLSFAR